ncbi:hypothetical protein RP20_CCG013467 [Aedes albopictus]|nr:hypothetical protein RP20_CCG013467 [Aedes albopictus]
MKDHCHQRNIGGTDHNTSSSKPNDQEERGTSGWLDTSNGVYSDQSEDRSLGYYRDITVSKQSRKIDREIVQRIELIDILDMQKELERSQLLQHQNDRQDDPTQTSENHQIDQKRTPRKVRSHPVYQDNRSQSTATGGRIRD